MGEGYSLRSLADFASRDYNYEHVGTTVRPEKDKDRIKRFLEVHGKIEDREAHDQLRDDLVEHLWQLHEQ